MNTKEAALCTATLATLATITAVSYSLGKDKGIYEQQQRDQAAIVEYVNITPKDGDGNYEVKFQTRDGSLFSCKSDDLMRGKSIDTKCTFVHVGMTPANFMGYTSYQNQAGDFIQINF